MKALQYVLLIVFLIFFNNPYCLAEAFKSAGPSDGEAKVLYFLLLTGSLLAIAMAVLFFASMAQFVYKEKSSNHHYYILVVVLTLVLPAILFQENALVPIIGVGALSMLGWFFYKISEPDANFGKWFFQILITLIVFIVLGVLIIIISFLG